MNCDEAFEALTDLDSHDDAELRWHLQFCPRCRQMREVLSPALELFTERREPENVSAIRSARPTPQDGTATKPQFLTPEAVREAEQIAGTLGAATHPKRRGVRWAMVAMVMLLTGLTWFFVGSLPSEATKTPRNQESYLLADHCLWQQNRRPQDVSTLGEEPTTKWVVLSCVSCHLQ